MADINKIIDELLLELSVTYPFPNMKDKEQIIALMEICDDLGYGYIKPTLYELLSEAEDEKESGLFPGKFHLGGGYYSSKDGGEAEFKNDKGNLRPVTPEEKAKFDSKSGKTPSAEKPTASTSKEPSSETPPAEKPKDTPAEAPAPLKQEPVVKSKVDVLKSKVEKWSEKEKEFFNKGQDKPGSETRRSFGQALKDKVKGARNAIVHGLKHEVHTFKTAAKGISKLYSNPGGWRELEKEERKAIVSVGIKVASTALFAAVGGGLAHGAAAFAKHVALELVPHAVAETIIVGVGRASLFAGADGDDERMLGDFMDAVADNMENMEIPEELMMSMVDSYNEKKTSNEPQSEIIDLNELFNRLLKEEDGKGESSEFPGKFHLGGGYYSSKDGGAAEFKNDKGKLRPLTDKEKAELSKGAGGTDAEEPSGEQSDSDKPDTASMIDTATKALDTKEKEAEKDLPKQNPDVVLNDPNANAKSKAMARAFKSQQTIDKNKQEDSGKGTVGEPNRLQPANEDTDSKVQKFKGKKSGREIQTIEFEDGGMMFGTVHGNTKMVDDIIDQIKATIPQEEWENIVFLGEGGATNDAGELEFNDEMKYAAPQFEKLGAGIDTWDGDDLDVHNDQSKLYQKQKEKTGLNDSQVKAGNWASMIGQGEGTDTMSPADYLDDEGRQFLQDAAKEAGLPPIESWDNPTGEVPNEDNPEGSGDRGTLFRLAFPEDNGDKETKINDIQVAFNNARDENIVEKRKELVGKGKIPIVIAGESHVELVDNMMRGGSDKKSETKSVEPEKIADEMPEADKETFAKDGKALDGIEPQQLEQFNTDISKISKMIDDAKAKGEPAPNINLCDITIPGTNLYCDDNQGIPREEMPQFKGKAVEGSRAAGMETDKDGEVDTEPVFREMLKEKGVKVLQTEVPADKLKATQKDLVGEKVIGMMGALEKDPTHPKITAPIYVSRDGYVIDGHHRWAAIVAHNAKNPDNPIPMKTTVIDMDIKDAIPMANKFAEDMGIAAKKADAKDGELPTPKEPNEKEGGVIYPLGGGYYSDTKGGTAQYIKAESVVNKIFIDENIKFLNLLFEDNLTMKTPSGKEVMVKAIDVKDQPEANKEVEKAKELINNSTKSEIPPYQIDYYNDIAKETAVRIEENTPPKDRIAAMQILYGKLQLISMGQDVELDENDIANLSKLVISANARSGQLYDSSFGMDKDKGIESARKKSPNYANRNIDKNELLNNWDKINQYLDSKGVPPEARPKFKAGANTLIDNPPKIGHNPVSLKPNRIMESAPQTSAKELISQKTIDDLYEKQGIKVGDDKMFGFPLDRDNPSTFLKNIELVVSETQKYIDESNSPDTKKYFDKFNKGISDILNDATLSEDEKLQKINEQLPELFTELYNDALQVSEDEAKNVLKDFGELIVYMDFLSRKEEVYLPVSGNYPLGDVIVVKRDGNGDALTIDSVSIKSQRGSEEQPGSSAFEFTKHFGNVYPEHKDIFDTLGALHTNSIDSVKMEDIKDEKIKKEIELIKKLENIKSFDEAKKVCEELGIEWEKVELQLKYQYEKYKNEIEYSPESMRSILKELVFRRYSSKKTLDTLCDLNLDTKLKFVEVVVEPNQVSVRPKGENSNTCDFGAHDKGYLGKGKVSKTPPPPHVEQVKYQSANLALRFKPKKSK